MLTSSKPDGIALHDRGRQLAGSLVNRLLVRFGYRLGRIHQNDIPLDLRTITDDPIEGLYRAGGRPFLIEIPLKRTRGLTCLAFQCLPGTGHPLIETALAYINGQCNSFAGSPMDGFYKQWVPSSAAVALGLPTHDGATAFSTAPPYGAVLPWYNIDLVGRISGQPDRDRKEHLSHGVDMGNEGGNIGYGPMSRRKGDLEFARIKKVVDSIRQKGYCHGRAGEGDINGYLLVDRKEWVFVVRGGGQHRVAALAALGLSHVPVRIGMQWDWWPSGSVRRDDVDSWPNVCRGLFTRKQALELFDRILEGRQPADCPTHWHCLSPASDCDLAIATQA